MNDKELHAYLAADVAGVAVDLVDEIRRDNAEIQNRESERADKDHRLGDFARWLAKIGYPFDVQFDPAPPVGLLDLAEGWHQVDPTVTYDEWLSGIYLELGTTE